MSRIVAVAPALPDHAYAQAEITAELSGLITHDATKRAVLERFHAASGIGTRHTVLPIEQYRDLRSFGDANDIWIREGTSLAARAVAAALAAAGLHPEDVDYLFFTSVTGIAAPSIDARLVPALGMRRDVKRVPSFGLGCVAGAAGLARVHDYLLGHPDEIAVLVSVELCSLTLQRDDDSVANFVASGLFGDGAAAVVVAGARRAARLGLPGPDILGTRTALYPDSESVIGWDSASCSPPRSPTRSTRTSPTTSRGCSRRTTSSGMRWGRGSRTPAVRGCSRRSSAASVSSARTSPRPGGRSTRSATCRRRVCCMCSPTPSTSRRAPTGCCSRSGRA
jgi:predicted naringenin-chalcone synthase